MISLCLLFSCFFIVLALYFSSVRRLVLLSLVDTVAVIALAVVVVGFPFGCALATLGFSSRLPRLLLSFVFFGVFVRVVLFPFLWGEGVVVFFEVVEVY